MGRTYAGILGCLGMSLSLVREIRSGADPDVAINHALIVLVIFATAGFLLGRIAEAIIDESVRGQLEQELAMSSPPSAKVSATRVA
ncbi:MAG: hypothetical protein WD851_00220 [Pirellulales bacterium]